MGKSQYKVLAISSQKEGLLPMKQSPELEAQKSDAQIAEETCNFIKTVFVVSGDVKMVKAPKPIMIDTFFLAEDKERGDFLVFVKDLNT